MTEIGTGYVHMHHLRQAVKKHSGATLECGSSGKWCVWQICAPDGYMWGGTGSIHLKVEWLKGDAKYRDEAIRDAIERLESEELVEGEVTF